MGTHPTDDAARSGLRKLALPAVIAAAAAGVGWLFTMDSRRLRRAASELPESARDLVSDLKQRAESVAERVTPDSSDQDGASGDLRELQARRSERRQRRERRRKHATT